MLNGPFAPWPSYGDDEARAVADVLLSNRVNYWTGDEGRAFEHEFAEFVGTSHAIAVANGTVALELALRGLGIGPGDEVIVTPRTFLASASSIVAVGAVPVFADVDRDSQNITAATVAEVLTPRTRGIIAVHLAGWPCELDTLVDLAREQGLVLIEDCAQAHGARYRGRSVGAWGDVGAWSFCQDKIMTTGGEGGMVTTRDPELWRRMWAYKDHGKSWDAVQSTDHPPGFRWLHESFGTNWRMTEMQAVLGRLQLAKLPDWTRRRRANLQRIWSVARECPGLRVPEPPAHIEHAAYKGYVFLEPERLRSGWTRERIIEAVGQRGVPLFGGSCSEVYREKAFEGSDWRPARSLPVAHELGETSLMFLVHPTLTERELTLTADVLKDVMTRACR